MAFLTLNAANAFINVSLKIKASKGDDDDDNGNDEVAEVGVSNTFVTNCVNGIQPTVATAGVARKVLIFHLDPIPLAEKKNNEK